MPKKSKPSGKRQKAREKSVPKKALPPDQLLLGVTAVAVGTVVGLALLWLGGSVVISKLPFRL